MDRRNFVSLLPASALAGAFAPSFASAHRSRARRRLLCFTKSSGFEHDVVKRGADGGPSIVDRAIAGLAEEHGFDVTCTKDGGIFNDESLAGFDAMFLFTSGDLTESGTDGQPPMTPDGKTALFDAVRNGKGLVAVHSASDTFHSRPHPTDPNVVVDPFITMVGGEFLSHGRPQTAPVRIVDESFPGMAGFGAGTVERFGEWYSLVNINPDMHVLAVLETEGMQGNDYRRAPYPVVWARHDGEGRVLYSALGHFEQEWQDPAFLSMLEGSLRWAFGDAPADLVSNLTDVAPGFADVPPAAPAR